jgi:hypothetical protein
MTSGLEALGSFRNFGHGFSGGSSRAGLGFVS